jgi:hypothetical protein
LTEVLEATVPLRVLTLEMIYQGLYYVSITGPQQHNIDNLSYHDAYKNKDLIDKRTLFFLDKFKHKLAIQRDRFPQSIVNSEIELCLESAAKESEFKSIDSQIHHNIHPISPIQSIVYSSVTPLKCAVMKDKASYVIPTDAFLSPEDQIHHYVFTPHVYVTMVLQSEN